METPSPAPFDLIVRGEILDPSHRLRGRYDLGLRDGLIAAVEPSLEGHPTREWLDAGDAFVCPGFIDLHAHVYAGVTSWGVWPDPPCLRSGVTTVVDAGSPGWTMLQGFRWLIHERSRVRALCFLHISGIGLVNAWVDECRDIHHLDPLTVGEHAAENDDLVVGIKVRQGLEQVGEHGVEPLKLAIEAARHADEHRQALAPSGCEGGTNLAPIPTDPYRGRQAAKREAARGLTAEARRTLSPAERDRKEMPGGEAVSGEMKGMLPSPAPDSGGSSYALRNTHSGSGSPYAIRNTEYATPVMCHIAPGIPLARVLELLRPGDIVTHCFQGRGAELENLTDSRGRLLPEVLDARQRGVVMDVGHGGGSFRWEVAEQALEQGFLPDVVSTDLHAYNMHGPLFDMAATLTKFLYLGMPLEQVVACATAAPARAIGRPELGTLAAGSPADLALIRIANEPIEMWDAHFQRRTWDRRLKVEATVRAGIIYRPEEVEPETEEEITRRCRRRGPGGLEHAWKTQLARRGISAPHAGQ